MLRISDTLQWPQRTKGSFYNFLPFLTVTLTPFLFFPLFWWSAQLKQKENLWSICRHERNFMSIKVKAKLKQDCQISTGRTFLSFTLSLFRWFSNVNLAEINLKVFVNWYLPTHCDLKLLLWYNSFVLHQPLTNEVHFRPLSLRRIQDWISSVFT